MAFEPTEQSYIPTISIAEEVRKTGICPPALIAEALGHLQHLGIVVLANAINPAHLDALNAVLAPESAVLAAKPGRRFNFGPHTNNINQAPPTTEPLMFRDVWANPAVLSILTSVLGLRPVLQLASGNTVLQAEASARQPVHSDIDFPHPSFPFAFVVNIPLVDATAANGATEVWLGSHADTSIYDQIRLPAKGMEPPACAIIPALVKYRRALSPPVRAFTTKGSIVIRDLRLWHAGLPNLTTQPRVMLAFVWEAAWWRGRGRVRLPLAVRSLVESWERGVVPFKIAAEWTDGPVDDSAIASDSVDSNLASSDGVLLKSLL